LAVDETVKKTDFVEAFKRMHPEVSLLLGHNWREPLGALSVGNLKIHSVGNGLRFDLLLSPTMMYISYVRDLIGILDAGIDLKLSLGVRLGGETKLPTNAGCVSATRDTIRSLTLIEISIVSHSG